MTDRGNHLYQLYSTLPPPPPPSYDVQPAQDEFPKKRVKAPIQQADERKKLVRSRNSFEGLNIEGGMFEGCLPPNQGIALAEQWFQNQKHTKVLKPQLKGIDVCLETITSN